MYTEKFPMLRLVTTTLSFIFAADAVSLSMATLPLSSLPENHNHFPSSYADDASVHRQPHRDRQLTKQQHDLWHSRYSAIRSDNDNNNNNQSRNLQQPRIFGGRDAKTGQYAYYVHAIDEELCGGSLIAPDIVLRCVHRNKREREREPLCVCVCRTALFAFSFDLFLHAFTHSLVPHNNQLMIHLSVRLIVKKRIQANQ